MKRGPKFSVGAVNVCPRTGQRNYPDEEGTKVLKPGRVVKRIPAGVRGTTPMKRAPSFLHLAPSHRLVATALPCCQRNYPDEEGTKGYLQAC